MREKAMGMLSKKIEGQVRKEFEALDAPVKLVFFSQEMECEFCEQTRELIEEVAALDPRLSLHVYDQVKDKTIAEQYGIDKIPALAIVRNAETEQDYGIRFYGIPSGYEFTTLIEDIVMVSRGQSSLNEQTQAQLAMLQDEVHLQVFVTPTCPYCPQAVHLAHQMAMASDKVKADMVEAIEFPHLSHKYQVMGVPRTVINETEFVEGAAPEGMLMARIMETVA
jgi:glutaredoxin-like protein